MPLASDGSEVGENSRRLCFRQAGVWKPVWALREKRLLLLLRGFPVPTRAGSEAPGCQAGGHGMAVHTQAEKRGHCVVIWDRTRETKKKKTMSNYLSQGVVREQSRNLGHGFHASPGQGHGPWVTARLIHSRLQMRTAAELEKALPSISRCVRTPSGSLYKLSNMHINRIKGLFAQGDCHQ